MEDFKNFTPYEAPEEGLDEYLESFLESRKRDLEEMRSHYVKNNHQDVKKILHKWEGYAEPYGFGGLRPLSSQIRACLNLQNGDLFEKLYARTWAYLQYKEKTMLGK